MLLGSRTAQAASSPTPHLPAFVALPCRERERERRLEAKEAHGYKKSKLTRDRDRDISEKIALGMAKVRGQGGFEWRVCGLGSGV